MGWCYAEVGILGFILELIVLSIFVSFRLFFQLL